MNKKNENDIVIVAAKRTPICKAKRGHLAEVKNDMLVYYAIKGTLESVNLDPLMVDEICFGNGLSPMNGTIPLRMGALRAGISIETPLLTVNRQCASGMDSIEIICEKLRLDKIKIGIAGGFESMTHDMIPFNNQTKLETDIQDIKDCFLTMGETAEILAENNNISRELCDLYACKSFSKAFRATEKQKFNKEIIPIELNGKVIDFDDGIRETNMESLKKLRPVFKADGVSTAGNSSQLSDGACAVVLMKRKKAEELGLEIMGVVVDSVAIGVRPRIMGEGPVKSIAKLLKKNNLTIQDISYFEINEAFSSQAVYCIEKLGLDYSKVNIYGGSVALGHPIGCTGARIICTLLNCMKNENIKGLGIASLCVGSGYGVSTLIQKE